MPKAEPKEAPAPVQRELTEGEKLFRDLLKLDATYRRQGRSLATVVHELAARTIGLHDDPPAPPSHDPLAKYR